MSPRIVAFFLSALASTTVSCTNSETAAGTGGGSSTGPGLAAFQTSACKKEAQTKQGTPGEAAQALGADDVYAGLQCVRWATIDGGFRVSLLNFEGACGAQWQGKVTAADAALELRMVNPDCRIAACGWCIYDFSFDVRMAAAASGNDVSLVMDPCPGQQTPTTQAVHLPLGAETSGELCRYANAYALEDQAMSLGTCGRPYLPCREAQSSGVACPANDGGAPCDDGLTCADGASATGRVCHATCKVDGDCLPSGVMKCDAGLCRPAHPF